MRLLERDAELRALLDAVRTASGGEGAGFAVTGDGGAGKSSLVDALFASADPVRFLRGHCDPLRTPRPLGPFRDLWASAVLAAPDPSRDVVLAELCEQAFEALRAEPTVLVVEDLHWADAATVEVLRFLVRRIEAMPLVLVATYRDVEIGPRHSARTLLGDFARLDGLTTLPLAALSPDAVAELLNGSDLDVARVHEITGGNPFFVTEVAKEPDLPLPSSVRDAVLARAAEISDADFEVLQLIATAPDRLDDRVLPALGVDLPTLRRIDATSLLARTDGGIVFRHELARQSLESTIPPGAGPGLHARLLAALEGLDPREPAVLTHHAVGARDAGRAARYARQAAAEAIRTGAHTEAAAFFEIALEHSEGAPAEERAALLLELSYQQYMVSRLPEAMANVRATFPLWDEAGDRAGLSAAHQAVAVYEYYSARRSLAEQHATQAADIAVELGSSEAPSLLYAEARTTHAYLKYMRSEPDVVRDYLDQASRVAERERSTALTLRTEMVAEANALSSGEVTARERLVATTEAARSAGLDELASTGYSNMANLDVEHARLRSAERVLELSLPFTVERDIPICRHWQTGVRSRLNLAQGHWSAALEDAATVLDLDGMPLATLWPLLVTGLVPLRRGEGSDLAPFDAAWALAERIDEPVRRLAVLAGLGEWSWTTGQPDERLAGPWVDKLLGDGAYSTTAWASGALAVWLRRLGDPRRPHGPVAEPHQLALDGRHREAAAWWHRAGDPFLEAMALADSAEVEDRLQAVKQLDRLGAIGTADRLRGDLRTAGVTTVPQRPRTSTRANPAGLTNRQLDVAKLVARGLSNAEIADRLYISAKTVDHHVSAVLAKLGLQNRRAIVVQAEELGLG